MTGESNGIQPQIYAKLYWVRPWVTQLKENRFKFFCFERKDGSETSKGLSNLHFSQSIRQWGPSWSDFSILLISEDRINISFVPRIITLFMTATMCLNNLVLCCYSLLHLDFPCSPDFFSPGNKLTFEFKQVFSVMFLSAYENRWCFSWHYAQLLFWL